MRYYCSNCKKTITLGIYQFSMDKFHKSLCTKCQKKPDYTKAAPKTKELYQGISCKPKASKVTPETIKLFQALIDRGVPAELEKWDGFKHIDIAITESKVNIEVDGKHHNFSNKHALADLKRTYYSFKKGYLTLRIPNSLVKEDVLDETADYIVRFLNASNEQLEDIDE